MNRPAAINQRIKNRMVYGGYDEMIDPLVNYIESLEAELETLKENAITEMTGFEIGNDYQWFDSNSGTWRDTTDSPNGHGPLEDGCFQRPHLVRKKPTPISKRELFRRELGGGDWLAEWVDASVNAAERAGLFDE